MDFNLPLSLQLLKFLKYIYILFVLLVNVTVGLFFLLLSTLGYVKHYILIQPLIIHISLWTSMMLNIVRNNEKLRLLFWKQRCVDKALEAKIKSMCCEVKET